jgi:DegV family protein with EDD domain
LAVKIVTDRTCDISAELEKELNITNIPVYLVFGQTSYRDGVDMTTDQFYQKLLHEPIYPSTSQPTPKDFVDVFEKLSAEGADGILAIHISKKLSGTINSAEQAIKMVKTKTPITIIDSESVSVGLGIQVLAAARMAKAGKSLAEISAAINKMVPLTKVFILFDTLEYLAKGGRIGKAKSLMGSILNVKPMIAVKDGELVPSGGQVRSRAKGKEKLLEFANSAKNVEDLAVIHSTTPDEAMELVKSITSFPRERIMIQRVGPVLATHAGPGVLGIALRTKS